MLVGLSGFPFVPWPQLAGVKRTRGSQRGDEAEAREIEACRHTKEGTFMVSTS
jgi:hypothetical protein